MKTVKSLKLRNGVDSDRLSDAVYETVLVLIIEGKLAPGMIVSELELSRKLNVSRTPVHDALKQLAKDGLVTQKANKRAVVAGFTADDVFDIFEMRKLLETEAARRAATRIDRLDLTRLRDTANRISKAVNKPDWIGQWTEFDELFHKTIAEASGSLRLALDIARYRMLHRAFNRHSTTGDVLGQALAEHLRILEALESRDAKAAAAEMRAHIHEWQTYFVGQFKRKANASVIERRLKIV
jgi:DNA-binding GntR family transcriptional regulator